MLALAIQRPTQCPDYYFDLQWMKWWDGFLGLEGTTLEREREPDVMYIWRLPHADSHTDTKELKKRILWNKTRVEGAQKEKISQSVFVWATKTRSLKPLISLTTMNCTVYIPHLLLFISLSLLYTVHQYTLAHYASVCWCDTHQTLSSVDVCHSGAIRIANNLV